jgi:hypothetical protein
MPKIRGLDQDSVALSHVDEIIFEKRLAAESGGIDPARLAARPDLLFARSIGSDDLYPVPPQQMETRIITFPGQIEIGFGRVF